MLEFDGCMQLPQRLARFNRHVTNPIQRMWAGWAPSFGILEHVGRSSGKPYRTPLTVFNAEVDGKPGVAILLTYGPDRDWLKNLNAAGGGEDAPPWQDVQRRQPADRQQGAGSDARRRRGAPGLRQVAVRAGGSADQDRLISLAAATTFGRRSTARRRRPRTAGSARTAAGGAVECHLHQHGGDPGHRQDRQRREEPHLDPQLLRRCLSS